MRDERHDVFAPSLERIDTCGDYTPDNVRVVATIFNTARSNFPDEALRTLAEALVKTDFGLPATGGPSALLPTYTGKPTSEET